MLNHALGPGRLSWRCLLFITPLSLLLSGCKGGSSSPPVVNVSVSPSTFTVQAGAAVQFAATVTNDLANRGVTWTVTCPTASCGSITPTSTASGSAATYTAPAAPPSSSLTVTITATSVSDGTKSSSATVTVMVPKLMISTSSLSDGTVGAPYSDTIQASGGVAPFTWSVFSFLRPGHLPAGLTLLPSSSNSVAISGTPTTVESQTFGIRVADASGQFAAVHYFMSIKGATVQISNGSTVQGTLIACGLPECAASTVLEFLGIPYAAPPVGLLRWKPPQPATPSQLQQPGVRCMSVNGRGQVVGSEDCLYLNVFVSSQIPQGQPLPVMVYIHGGADRKGSGNPGFDYSDPPELATQGVILVTVEFRVGILGFVANSALDLENASHSSGNYGLRDEIAALAWVQQNIASFGGDPTHITVFGSSSGSLDIEALLTSPLTQGPTSQCGANQQCFSAAIMEGGSVVSGQLLTGLAKENQDAPLVAGLTGTIGGLATACDTLLPTPAPFLACLRSVSAATLVAPCIPPATINCNPNAAYSTWYTQTDPVLIVNLEPDVVPVNPYDWLQQHGGSPVPLLLGSNREDASMAGVPSWCAGVSPSAPQCPNDDPTANPPLSLHQYQNAVNAEANVIGGGVTGAQILGLYPASAYDAPVWALIAVDSDLTVGATCPYREVARAAVASSGPPVWRYIYTHTFENNDPLVTPYRAFHGAQNYFVFGDPSFADPGTYMPTSAELALSGQIMGYWTSFAATGNPNGAQATVWPPYYATTDPMLQIDDTSVQINGYRTAQCDFYDKYAPTLANVQ